MIISGEPTGFWKIFLIVFNEKVTRIEKRYKEQIIKFQQTDKFWYKGVNDF